MKSRRSIFLLLLSLGLVISATVPFKGLQWKSLAQSTGLTVGRNVNIVSGVTLPGGDPTLNRQNEVMIAASTRNPFKLLAVCNDYRGLDTDLLHTQDAPPGQEIESIAKDAWGGVFQSHNGGASWSGTLLPGYFHYETTPSGRPGSPLYNRFSAVADLYAVASTNGLFHVSGIAFNRENRNGNVVFNARYLDYNDQENADTIKYLDTKIVWEANQDQFIDKSVCAVQLPSGTAHTIDIDGNGQIIPVSNVYLAYTVFTGDENDGTLEGQIWFQRSLDSGETWEDPIVLSSGHLDQGASIAVDPRANGHICVSWRRFENGTDGDAILAAASTNAGADFNPAVEVISFPPDPNAQAFFDQPTQGDGNITSFRANTYPFGTMDGNGNTYLVWSQRESGPEPWARIMIATAGNDFGWSAPMQVFKKSPDGHQFWPVLSFSSDMLMLAWSDQRFDRGMGDCAPDHNYFIEDSLNDGCLHAIDTRVAYAKPSLSPVFSDSVQVSRYPFKVDLDTMTAKQLQDNWVNLRIYNQGWWSFMGDYMGLTASQTFIPKANGWVYNSGPNPGTIFHVAWTDMRDVNISGDFLNFTPPDGVSQDVPCIPSGVGVRNQNIYTAPISTTGIVVGSPANTKPLDIRRAFVVIVRNTTENPKNGIRLEIDSSGPEAKFWKAGQVIDADLAIDIPPYSTVANTVMVEPHSNPHIQVTINVIENGAIVGQTVLNPDKTNPTIQDPEDNPTEPIRVTEIHTPSFVNYWTYEDIDPDLLAFGVDDYGNVDPNSVNPDYVTPHVINPHVINPHVINPHVINPHVINTPPDDSDNVEEAIFEVTNFGNTTSSYSLRTFPLNIPEEVFKDLTFQILVAKVHTTPGAIGCDLAEQEHHELVANVTTPHVINTSQSAGILDANNMEPIDSDFYLNPDEKAYIIYRVYAQPGVDFDITSIFPNLIADVSNGNDGSLPPNAILITTPSLPDGVEGVAYPPDPVILDANGLSEGDINWEFVDPPDPDDPPDWLQISPEGELLPVSGVTPTVGMYNVSVRVSNTVNGQVTQFATRTFSIRIVAAMAVDGEISLPEGYIGWPYNGSIPIVGGIEPYFWETTEGELPPGLTLGEGITGTPEKDPDVTSYPETYTFTITITDSTNPSQSIRLEDQNITIAGVKKFGGEGDQEATSVVFGDDGYIYVTGYTTAHDPEAARSDKDFYTAKFTSGGVLVWEQTYDGPAHGDDAVAALAVMTAGNSPGVYVTGYSDGDGSLKDYATIRYSLDNGNPLWAEGQVNIEGVVRYNGPGNADDIPVAIIAKGGQVCVTGSSVSENTGPDFYTVIYDAVNGNVAEEARYDGPSHLGDFPEAMILDSADIYITGWLHRGNKDQHADFVTVKYDRYLNQEWDNTWDSRRNGIDESYSVDVDSSGNAVITGKSQEDLGEDFDYLTVKYNLSGKKMLWDAREDQTFGDDIAIGVAVDESDNIYVVGYSEGANNETDFYIIGYDRNGNRLSDHSHRIEEPGEDVVIAMTTGVDASGHFCIYLTGYSTNGGNTDVLTVKYDTVDKVIKTDRCDISDYEQGSSIVLDNDGNVYVAGYAVTAQGDKDFFILKYGPALGAVVWKIVK